MEWMTKRGEAEPYPDGTPIKSKKDGSHAVIVKQCYCGDGSILHYEVRINSKSYPTIFQHSDIERLFEIVNETSR